ncbi:MAG TPA: hypothetical protein VEO54_05670 [Thermoanaerobaculia bacterium]|nr:hypothetical protein [Thermoanaerobaculia bacterium]
MSRSIFTAVLIAVLPVVSLAETARTFAGRSWSIQVPEGYTETTTPSDERTFIVAYAPAPRPDGTRPMILVTLADVRGMSDTPESRQKIAEATIAGVQRRRDEWQVEKSDAKVGDMPVVRYAWSGVTIPASDGAAARLRARGVMLVGVDRGVAFVLHTQDVDAHAGESIPALERLMATFRFGEAQGSK